MVDMIKEKFKERDIDISSDEAEALYDMLTNSDTMYFIDRIGASEFWNEIQDAKEQNDTYNQFEFRFLVYFDDPMDDDIKDRLKRIYEEYIL